jgi:putative ABC transport system permease protein
MSSRWKKVWADFWHNKTRSILTILTIAIGTIAVGFSSNLQQYMVVSMESDFLSVNPSEATIAAFPLDEESLRIARGVPGVNSVEGENIASANVIRPDDTKIAIVFRAVDELTSLTANQVKPAEGEPGIPAVGDKQLVLDSSAAALGYKPGDMIVVELNDGKRRQLQFVGYLHSPTGIPYRLAPTLDAYVNTDTMVWLGGSRGFNQLAVSVAENPTDADHVTDVAQAVADALEHSGAAVYYVYVYEPGHHFAYSIAQGMFSIMGVLGWLTVLLGVFLVVNTIMSLMAQQTRQIGIMKATGGGTIQIFAMYVTLILVFGLGALLVAVPLANWAAKFIGDGMARYLNFFPARYTGYQSTLIQQVLVAVVLPLLAVLWPLYHSVRITVREALSDYGIGGSKPKDKSIVKSTLLLSRPMRLSLQNAFRRKLRLALTLFTLVLAGAIFISVLNLRDGFAKVLEDVQGYFLADINVSFARSYRFDRVAPMAQRVPGVDGIEGWLEIPGSLITGERTAERQIQFIAPPSNSQLIKPIMTSGRWLAPGDENAVVVSNRLFTMLPGMKLGDGLTIKIDGKETRWQIIGTYAMIGNSPAPMLYVNYEYMSSLLGAPGIAQSLRIITTSHDAATQKRVNDSLLALFEERGIAVSDSSLSTDWYNDQTSTFDIFVWFMLVMAVMIALVGGLGLMGTMSINVLERTREIGVMRAIGASNWNIQSIVMFEGMVIGIFSWILSIALAVPITVALSTGVGIAILKAPMPAVFGITGPLLWLAVITVIGTLASALPAAHASRLTVRDTLAYE